MSWWFSFALASCLLPLILKPWSEHLYKQAFSLSEAGHYQETINILRRVLRIWALLRVDNLPTAQLLLAKSYVLTKRYYDCIHLCLNALNGKPNPYEALQFQWRMVTSLTAVRKIDEASRVRQSALQSFCGTPSDHITCFAYGELLLQEAKLKEGYSIIEQALSFLPVNGPADGNIERLYLAESAMKLNHAEQAIRWAEEVIARPAQTAHLLTAHSHAGANYTKLRQFDKAKYHLQKKYDLAVVGKNTQVAAETLLDLITLLYRQGQIEHALALVAQTVALCPSLGRRAYSLQGICLVAQGHYEDAKHALYQALESATSAAASPKLIAPIHLYLSRILSECRQWEAASAQLNEARMTAGMNDAFKLRCLEMETTNLAREGRLEEALAMLSEIYAKLPDISKDRTGYLSSLIVVIAVLFMGGKYEHCLDYCQLQSLNSYDPVHQPKVLYYRGECQWRLGNQEAARDSWRQAVALNIDTVATRKAQSRLTECS